MSNENIVFTFSQLCGIVDFTYKISKPPSQTGLKFRN